MNPGNETIERQFLVTSPYLVAISFTEAVHQQRSAPSVVGGRGRRGKRKRRETEDEVVERGDEESDEGREELRTLLKQVIMVRNHSPTVIVQANLC